MTITHNNVLYDGTFSGTGEVPIKVVPSLSQLYPVGSVCSLNLMADGRNLTMFLRADIRLEAEWASPAQGPISLIGGRTIKVDPLTQISKEYE